MPEVVVARSAQEFEGFRPAWEALPVDHPHADPDFVLAVVAARDEALRPHALLLQDAGAPVGLVVMRLEEIRLPANFGYRTLYNPRVRALTLVPGGAVVADDVAADAAARALLGSLEAGEADVAIFPSLRHDSPLFDAMTRSVSTLRHGRFAEVRTHRRLRLPESYEAFLAARSKKVRSGVRYDAKRLEERLGDRLRIVRLDSPDDLDAIFRDVVRIADLTYQRGLGASFADTPERRRLTKLMLENGWFRAWVLYDGETPIAFWQGSVYRGVYHSGSTGYDPAYARDRVGIWLLMRVIEELCAEPGVDVFDFGFGDADYKRHFSDESWEESDLTVFAPRLRALAVNAGRITVMGAAAGAKSVAERFGLTARLKTRWRARLRS
jgi:CelD/BcsL family acetyltransferase involved in cellulose biosynthesis